MLYAVYKYPSFNFFSSMYLYLCIFVLISGLAFLVVRFSINLDKRKYSDYRKFILLSGGIILTIGSFIGFYMYFTDKLFITINEALDVEACSISFTTPVILLLGRLKYFKHGIYMGVENAKK